MTRRQTLQLTASAVLVGSTAGCLGASHADNNESTDSISGWPMQSRDRVNSGHNPDFSTPNVETDERWSVSFDESFEWHLSPLVADGVVFVPSRSDHRLYAFDAASGDERWHFDVDDYILFTPCLHGKTIYVIDESNTVTAISTDTGDERWTTEIPSEWGPRLRGAPTTDGDRVYICATTPFTVYSLDTDTGDEAWHTEFEGDFGMKPAVVDETVYVTRPDSVVALDSETGDEQSRFNTDRRIVTPPSIDDDQLYVVAVSELVAFDLENGDSNWTLELDTTDWNERSGTVGRRTPLAVDDDAVYVPYLTPGSELYRTDNSILVAVNKDGEERWTVETEEEIQSGLSVGDGAVHAASDHGVFAFETEDGDRRWHVETDTEKPFPGTTPVLVDDAVYVGVGETLYALGG